MYVCGRWKNLLKGMDETKGEEMERRGKRKG